MERLEDSEITILTERCFKIFRMRRSKFNSRNTTVTAHAISLKLTQPPNSSDSNSRSETFAKQYYYYLPLHPLKEFTFSYYHCYSWRNLSCSPIFLSKIKTHPLFSRSHLLIIQNIRANTLLWLSHIHTPVTPFVEYYTIQRRLLRLYWRGLN